MTPIVQLNNQPIPFQPGVRKDTSLVMAVLSNKENGIDTSALDSKAVSNLLVKLPDNIRLALIDAVVRNGRLNDINASKQELQKIANALITKDENQFGLDSDSKLIVGVSGSEETIDGIDEVNGAVKNDAILADVAADKYDEFSKSMLEIQAPPTAPSQTEKVLVPESPAASVDKPQTTILEPKQFMPLTVFIDKVIAGNLTSKDLTDPILLPKVVLAVIPKGMSVADQIVLLNILGKQGYFGEKADYADPAIGVFSDAGKTFKVELKVEIGFSKQFFDFKNTFSTVNKDTLTEAIDSLYRSYTVSQMLDKGADFSKFATSFINASNYLEREISTTVAGATTNLADALSGKKGGPVITDSQLTGLSTAVADAISSKGNLPISNGTGAQLSIDPNDDTKVVLSVLSGPNNKTLKPIMSFSKDAWDNFDAFVNNIQGDEEKKLWFLNFLEYIKGDDSDKVQTWANGKLTEKSLKTKAGDTVVIEDPIEPVKNMVEGIDVNANIKILDMLPANSPLKDSPALLLSSFAPPAKHTVNSYGVLENVAVKDNQNNKYFVFENIANNTKSYYLVKFENNSKGGRDIHNVDISGEVEFTFVVDGLSSSKTLTVEPLTTTGTTGGTTGTTGGTQKTLPAANAAQTTGFSPGKIKATLPPLVLGMTINVDEFVEGADLFSFDGNTFFDIAPGDEITIPENGNFPYKETTINNGVKKNEDKNVAVTELTFYKKTTTGKDVISSANIEPKTSDNFMKLLGSPAATQGNVFTYLKNATDVITATNITGIIDVVKDKPEVLAMILVMISSDKWLNLIKIDNNAMTISDVIDKSGIAAKLQEAFNLLDAKQVAALCAKEDFTKIQVLVKGWMDGKYEESTAGSKIFSDQQKALIKALIEKDGVDVILPIVDEIPLVAFAKLDDDVLMGLYKTDTFDTETLTGFSKDSGALAQLIKVDITKFISLVSELRVDPKNLLIFDADMLVALIQKLTVDQLKDSDLAQVLLKGVDAAQVAEILDKTSADKWGVLLDKVDGCLSDLVKEWLLKEAPQPVTVGPPAPGSSSVDAPKEGVEYLNFNKFLALDPAALGDIIDQINNDPVVQEKLKGILAVISTESVNNTNLMNFLSSIVYAATDNNFIIEVNSALDKDFKTEMMKAITDPKKRFRVGTGTFLAELVALNRK